MREELYHWSPVRRGGVITVNRDKCVGCYTCILSCPYGCVMPSENGVIQKVRAVHEKQRGFSCLCERMSQ